MRRVLLLVAAVSYAVPPAAASTSAIATASATKTGPHVWVIALENKTYDETFGPDSPAPYLSKVLPSRGALLRQYYGTGHLSLDNYVSMISGQAPNPATQGDCQFYADFVGSPALDRDGQAVGAGCVHPDIVRTLPDQLERHGVTWKGYMQDMGTPCRHPALNTPDDTQQAEVGDEYAARHDPFVYFHSIIDDQQRCDAHVVDLANLPNDLADATATPRFSFITPDLCHDGHDSPCVDGKPGGLVTADAFLRRWVPIITSSPAFQADGVLVVTFDEAEASGADSDASACCHEPAGPNTPMPGITGPGGGHMGAVVLSPFVRPGTITDEPYNHYSLLRTLEDLYHVAHLGYAAQPGLQPFGRDVFTRARPTAA